MAHLLLLVMFLSVWSVYTADGNSPNEETVSGSEQEELRRLKAAVERLESAERRRQVEETRSARSSTHSFSSGTTYIRWGRTVCQGDAMAVYRGSSSRGITYIRWGRTVCQGDAVAVYRGHVAGGQFNVAGGGSNYLCLHERPQWRKYIAGFSNWAGQIFGVEHELGPGGKSVFSYINHGGRSLHNYPAACSGCYLPRRSAVMMIPARAQCPLGWTMEYDGYIISELPGHQRSEYVCWDKAPESAIGGVNKDQAVIYPVKVVCGSLPCSRYLNSFELACVVCSK